MPLSECSNLSKLSLVEAERLIRPVNAPLANSFSKLVKENRKKNNHKRVQPTLYLGKYAFGALLAGPRYPNDYLAGFLPPCTEHAKKCNLCNEVSRECANEWPLFIILNNTIEEFLVDRADEESRLAPTRLLTNGQILGLSEIMNQVFDPTFHSRVFRTPVRNASAGIRSVYITAPVGSKLLKDSLKAIKLKNRYSIADPALWSSDWADWEFLRATAQVGLEAEESSWTVQVIIIPAAWFRSNLYSNGEIKSAAKDLLLQLSEIAWKESRGLRSESIRQIALSQTVRGREGNTNADWIVQRLLLVLRGDAPGFRPAAFSDERLPLTSIWKTLISNEQIQRKFFVEQFPGIIEPFHLNRRDDIPKGTFFYYPLTSFEQLGYAGNPVDELDSIEVVDKLLRTLQDKNPEMLGQIKWEFFASPAPLESKLIKTQSTVRKIRSISVPFTSAELSDVIHKDFELQMQSASNFGPVPTKILSKPPRKGFLRRFIRVSVH